MPSKKREKFVKTKSITLSRRQVLIRNVFDKESHEHTS